jgi:hypothetical protein
VWLIQFMILTYILVMIDHVIFRARNKNLTCFEIICTSHFQRDWIGYEKYVLYSLAQSKFDLYDCDSILIGFECRGKKMHQFRVVACLCWATGFLASSWKPRSLLPSRPQWAGMSPSLINLTEQLLWIVVSDESYFDT